ncbi:RanBP1 domain containing protein [Tritrichomonas foetus]|uniref:RanBP1 domain containing protein n=1 Tax=Tritrichomonas foetus TaxID=1144522 RepID=A0A1J4KF13_9EUKA|nr:RanBP1 domain containing protein [Tritrichomonas foetus]|eukprot:OHT09771.1 RanBP1 domain containing protein [Tritrichomonas foetus]
MSISSESNEPLPEEFPPIAEVPNADTDEEELFANKAILFIFNREKNEWIDRGTGELKILKNPDTGYVRIIMRQNQTYVVRANHQIPYLGSLHVLDETNREFSWTAYDFTDTKEPENREMFAVRFSLPDIATAFKTAFEAGQAANKELMDN